MESRGRLRLVCAWAACTEAIKVYGTAWELRVFLRWPAASWMKPPSACGSCEAAKARRERVCSDALIVASNELRRSPELVSRHLLLLCAPHSQASRERFTHLNCGRWGYAAILPSIFICYYDHFNAQQHAVYAKHRSDSVIDGARVVGGQRQILV